MPTRARISSAQQSQVRFSLRISVVEQEGAHIAMDFSDDVREAAQNVLEALQMHYREMQENYPEFIQVTEV